MKLFRNTHGAPIHLPQTRPLPIPISGGGGGGLIPPHGGQVGPHIPPPSGGGVGPHIPSAPQEVGPHIPPRRGRTMLDAEVIHEGEILGNRFKAGSSGTGKALLALGVGAGTGYMAKYLQNKYFGSGSGSQKNATSGKPQWRADRDAAMEVTPSAQLDSATKAAQAWEQNGKPESDARILDSMSPIARQQLAYMNAHGMPTAQQWEQYQSKQMNNPEVRARIAQSMDAQRYNQWYKSNREPTPQEVAMGIDKGYIQAEQALLRGEITPDQMPIRRGMATSQQLEKAVQNTMRTGIPLGDQYLQPNRQDQQKIGQAYIDQFKGFYDNAMLGINGEDEVSPKKAPPRPRR